jgi:uncharacterized protein YycO
VEFEFAEGYLGALPDGVKMRPFNYDPLCQYIVGSIDCDDNVLCTVKDFAYRQIGKPYDYSALIGLGIHRDWHSADAWFCSELVAAAFDWAYYPLIRDKYDRVTPESLLQSERVYLEGQ